MQLIGYYVLVALAILVCGSVVPVCEYIYFSFIKKENQKVYSFSKELLEAEYDSKVFDEIQKNFEERKQEEYSLKFVN